MLCTSGCEQRACDGLNYHKFTGPKLDPMNLLDADRALRASETSQMPDVHLIQRDHFLDASWLRRSDRSHNLLQSESYQCVLKQDR